MIDSILPIAHVLGVFCAISIVIAALVFFYLLVFYLIKMFICLIKRLR